MEPASTGAETPAEAWQRTTALALFILVASSGIDYLTQVLLGKWLGEADYGNYGVALSLALLFAYLSGLGTDESLPRFLPAYRTEGKIGHMVGFLRAHFAAIVVVSGIVSLAGMIVFLALGREKIGHPIAVIWWLVPPLAVAEFLYLTLYNMDRTLPALLIQMIVLPLSVLGATALFVLVEGHLTDDRTVAAYGIGALTVLPVYGFLLREVLTPEVRQVRPCYDINLWVRTAAPMILSTVAYYALGQADVYAMEHVGEEREVGILVACAKTADFVYLSYSAIYLWMAPRISPLVDAGRVDELRTLVRAAARSVLGLSAVTATLIVVFGRFILGWFGHQFSDGYLPLVILAASNVPTAALSLAWPLLSLSGHERVPLPGLVAALFALFLSVELTVPHYGILAAATCKAVVMMLLFGWLAWELMRKQGLRIWEIW